MTSQDALAASSDPAASSQAGPTKREAHPLPLTAGLLNRLDPRQPSEAEIHAAAAVLLEAFRNDRGAAGLWLINEAVRLQAMGDRRRNLIAVRMARSIRSSAKP